MYDNKLIQTNTNTRPACSLHLKKYIFPDIFFDIFYSIAIFFIQLYKTKRDRRAASQAGASGALIKIFYCISINLSLP